MAKTKFLRVAVAGFTASDGRTIEPHWLTEMAANYNPATFTARVNVEHIRNLSADGPFPALGDVLALKTQTDEIEIAGKKEKRVALYAQIEGNDILQGYLAKDQKKFTSIEIEPNFSGSGKAYLLGLAATDNPASLGTEALKFSAGQDPYAKELKAALDARKQHASCLFSAAIETTFEFDTAADAANPAAGGESALDKVLSAFASALKPKEEPKPQNQAADTPADPNAGLVAAFTSFSTGLTTALKADREASEAKFAKLSSELAGLKDELDTTPKNHSQIQRPATPGGEGAGVVLTDC
ncbi:GPO family capsid scaffolding protein [Brevundimonas sp. UBA7664]|uniref:GPO family capsid scaffolding protein n=1 Tax=Brevundimonas sp. UBA7664 TaxID=1946141 RepID=UPI0025C1197F|nr:GPO family capsid scaffolding protein [Brevundimonas sp. UBA7664]